MKYLHFSILLLALTLCACGNGASNSEKSEKDSAKVELPDLVGDSALTNAAKFYADKVDATFTNQRLAVVDSMVKTDMSDMQEKCKFAFYPFGGPDFLYPHHIFPNADTYFLMGLERPGTAPSTIEPNKVFLYANSLRDYLNASFYVTKNMKVDLATKDIDGALPLIAMLMAKDSCQIISVKYKDFDDKGNMKEADKTVASLAEVEFFSNATPKHKQTLYFYSGNTNDAYFSPGLKAYLTKTLKKEQVATFLKAASYLMHCPGFDTIRNFIVDNSFAILEDDSGVPYRYFDKSKWDFTLYGTYIRPLMVFTDACVQPDLDALYKQQAAAGKVKPMPLRIGYNNPSNWMVARKK